MTRQYSRLARTESKKQTRSAVFYIVLSVVLLTVLFFFGAPAISKIVIFINNVTGRTPISSIANTVDDNAPPSPPNLETPPEFTNQTNILVRGTAEPKSSITLFFNNDSRELIADDAGKFSISIGLNKGENKIFAVAKDSNGNKSAESKTYFVIFDNQAPDLTVDKPSDGAIYAGKNNSQISIEGTTEENASVTINDRVAVVDTYGKFSLLVTLSDGSNQFSIKATDQAGNQTEKNISVTYAP